jgi:hypothetical protein
VRRARTANEWYDSSSASIRDAEAFGLYMAKGKVVNILAVMREGHQEDKQRFFYQGAGKAGSHSIVDDDSCKYL